MSEFTRGFGHGFMHGVFNRMYGGWGYCGGGFNFFCGCNTPIFLTPRMDFNNFNRYFTPMANVSLPTFNFPKPNFTMPTFNLNLPIFSTASYSQPINKPTNFNFEYKPSYSWNNTVGDSFVKTTHTYDNTPKKDFTTSVSSKDNTTYDNLIEKYSKKYGVDPNLVKAMIKQESSFNPKAKSGAGAVGLMQLMPDTAKEVGVTDRTNPEQNIEGGIKYIKKMLNAKNGNVELALASYNAGLGNVKGRIPQNGETPTFVANVMQYYKEYQKG